MEESGSPELRITLNEDRFGESASFLLSQVLKDVTAHLSSNLDLAVADLVSVHKSVLRNGEDLSGVFNEKCRAVHSQRVSLDDLDGLSITSDGPSDDGMQRNDSKRLSPNQAFSGTTTPKGSPARPNIHSMRSLASLGALSIDDGYSTPKRLHSQSEAVSEMSSVPMSPADEAGFHYHPFELHALWKVDEMGRSSSTAKNGRAKRKSVLQTSKSQHFRSGEEVMDRRSCGRRCVMSPNSMPCLLWDVCCTIAIVHDMLVIPLTSAFPINDTDFTRVLALVSSSIWMTDLPLSFMRGYLDTRKGFVEMRPYFIASHYVRTWFMPDVTMVALDLMSLMVVTPNLEALTLLRLIRNLRILRLLKMTGRLAVLKETMLSLDPRLEFSSVYLETALTVLKQLAIIALLCHFMGCTWYALGSMTSLGQTWVLVHEQWRDENMATPPDWPYMYVTSMHWALTQFTPSSMDVVAVNMIERIFSLVVTLFGLIVFSFFIGSINQSLAKLRNVTAQELQQNQLVRRYINENRISVELAADILTFIKQRGVGKATSKLVFADIKVLEHLPRKLLSQMQEEVSMPVLQRHDLLYYLSAISYIDIARLCYKGLTEVSVVHGEEIFQAGQAGDRMYFNKGGKLSYFWEPKPLVPEEVLEDMRVAEPTLWLRWEYHGRLICEEQSAHFFHLEANAFRKAISRSELHEPASIYARLFLRIITEESSEEEASDLFGSDLHVQELMKMLKSWQDGAVKVFANLLENSLDIGTAFDAWREVVQLRKQQADDWWKWPLQALWAQASFLLQRLGLRKKAELRRRNSESH